MDELNIRRNIFANPQSNDKELIAAISNDPAKQKLADEMKAFDRDIASALNVPVPDDLYSKLILRQTMAGHQQEKRKSKIQYAIAASVTLVLGFTFQFTQFSSAYNSLGEQALAHVTHEEGHFENHTDSALSLASLNEKMAAFKGVFTESLGILISADYCRFDGEKSLHLVFQGKTSPVTVLVVPNNEALAFSANFANETHNGQSQHYEHTNIVVIGDKNESIAKWKNNINKHLTWKA